MQNKIIDFLKDKNVAILGFGVEGKSTYNYIRKYLKDMPLTIIDKVDQSETISDNYVSFVYGDEYLDGLDKYDVIIKTPGISLKDIDITNIKDKITSQLELLLMSYKDQVIGITGTKGKSTTTTLIYNVLKSVYDNTFIVGNIGIPILDEIDNFDENSIIVNEISSHQLEYVHYSPHIGIILNLYEDHLDHAGSVAHYHECKLNMFKYQNEDDISIYCDSNTYLKEYMKNSIYIGKKYKIQYEYDSNKVSFNENKGMIENIVLYTDDGARKLKGKHNLENILIASLVAYLKGVDLNKAKSVIDEFTGLEHRLELVGTYNGIKFYNDTIATIPEATMSGIEALEDVDTLIFGGVDRGINYQGFIDYLGTCNVKNLICMPDTGTRIGKELSNTNKNIFFCDTLDEAVKIANEVTTKGMSCLLSPSAASFNSFKNYKEKGNYYKKVVRGE